MMKRTQTFIEKRNARILKNIEECIAVFDLEATIRNFIREKIFQAYMPKDEELKMFIREEVRRVASSEAILSTASEKVVEKVVRERIRDLGKEFQRKIKNQIIEELNNDDYDN